VAARFARLVERVGIVMCVMIVFVIFVVDEMFGVAILLFVMYILESLKIN